MISGYFDHYGAPCVEGRLVVGRLEIDGYIQFLVDTGADSGALHPGDGQRLQCRFDLLDEPYSVEGIGGSLEYYPEEATIIFQDDDEEYEIPVIMDIAKPGSSADNLPSLLGRDVINFLRIDYHYDENLLRFYPPK